MTATATRLHADDIGYDDLYARWERGNWRATEIDFSEDRRQWREELTETERRAFLWNFTLFFHGEDSVTDDLGPFIDAAPLEEQKYFLATQQVDEARHAVFFARFMREVVGVGGDSVGEVLAATAGELPWGHRKVFELLDRVAAALRRSPSIPRLAAAVSLYHLVIEGSMAQPAQHLIERHLDDTGRLPGFRAGMANVSLDEQRHIGFGVKLLADLAREDERCAPAVGRMLRAVQPYDVAVFVPPNFDPAYAESLGFTLEEIYTDGSAALESRLRAAGLPMEDLPGGSPHPLHLTPAERADMSLRLLRAGIVGERNGPPSNDPEDMRMLFEAVRGALDLKRADRPLTVQWEFADAEPWYVSVAGGEARAERGLARRPDVRVRCRWQDWCDVVAGHRDAWRAILTGRIRLRGGPLGLRRLAAISPL